MAARPIALLAALTTALAGCYWSSAARHAGPILSRGWDVEERGPYVILTGPVSTVWAGAELAVRSVVPGEAAEPAEKWFRFYTGPMLAESEIAILCSSERAVHVHTIRQMEGGARFPARYHSWHFPLCIEALPGLYELEVHYFVRRTEDARDRTSTEHAESVEPSRVAWYAEAGGVYALRARVGATGQASAPTPRSRVARRASLGTSHFELEEGEWAAEIERLASADDLDVAVYEHRAAWERYEQLHEPRD